MVEIITDSAGDGSGFEFERSRGGGTKGIDRAWDHVRIAGILTYPRAKRQVKNGAIKIESPKYS